MVQGKYRLPHEEIPEMGLGFWDLHYDDDYVPNPDNLRVMSRLMHPSSSPEPSPSEAAYVLPTPSPTRHSSSSCLITPHTLGALHGLSLNDPRSSASRGAHDMHVDLDDDDMDVDTIDITITPRAASSVHSLLRQPNGPTRTTRSALPVVTTPTVARAALPPPAPAAPVLACAQRRQLPVPQQPFWPSSSPDRDERTASSADPNAMLDAMAASRPSTARYLELEPAPVTPRPSRSTRFPPPPVTEQSSSPTDDNAALERHFANHATAMDLELHLERAPVTPRPSRSTRLPPPIAEQPSSPSDDNAALEHHFANHGTAMDFDLTSSQLPHLPSAESLAPVTLGYAAITQATDPPSSLVAALPSAAVLPLPTTPVKSAKRNKRGQSPGLSPPPRRPKRSRLMYGIYVLPVARPSPTRARAPLAAPRLPALTPAPPAGLLPNKRRQSLTLDPPPTAKRSRTATSSDEHVVPHGVAISSLPLAAPGPAADVSLEPAPTPSVPAAPAPLPTRSTGRAPTRTPARSRVRASPYRRPILRPVAAHVAQPRVLEHPGPSVKEKLRYFETLSRGGQPIPVSAPTAVTRRNSVGQFVSSGSSRDALAGIVSAHGIQTASELPADTDEPLSAVVAPLPAASPLLPPLYSSQAGSAPSNPTAPYLSMHNAPPAPCNPTARPPASSAPSLPAVPLGVSLPAAPAASLQAAPLAAIPAPPPPSIRAPAPSSTFPPPPIRLPAPRTSSLRQPTALAKTTFTHNPSLSITGRENVPSGPTSLRTLERQTNGARPAEMVGLRLPLASIRVPPAAERRTATGGVRSVVSEGVAEASSKAGRVPTVHLQDAEEWDVTISKWKANLKLLKDVSKSGGLDSKVLRDCHATFTALEALQQHDLQSRDLKDVRFLLRVVAGKKDKVYTGNNKFATRAGAILKAAGVQ